MTIALVLPVIGLVMIADWIRQRLNGLECQMLSRQKPTSPKCVKAALAQ